MSQEINKKKKTGILEESLETGFVPKGDTLNPNPTIALIGLPNSGKSSLFNRIIGERKAIVADEEHTTRDVNKGDDYWNGYKFTFVDTGGLVPDATDKVHKMVQISSWSAIAKADILVWVIDRKTNPEIFTIAMLQRIWRLRKPLIIAINKVDNPNHDRSIADYANLGGEYFVNLSANSSYGINELMDVLVAISKDLGYKEAEIEIEEKKEGPAGKKKYIKEVIAKGNYFIVRNVLKDGSPSTYEMVDKDGNIIDDSFGKAATSEYEDAEGNPYKIMGGGHKNEEGDAEDNLENTDGLEEAMKEEKPMYDYTPKILLLGKPNVGKSTLINTILEDDIQIVSDVAGTTLSVNDYEYTANSGNTYSFIDSAGIRKKGARTIGVETFATFRTIDAAYKADLILFILDASQPISHQDQVVGGICKEAHKGLIILANKADLMDKDARDKFKHDLFKKFDFLKSEDLLFISAKEDVNIDKIFTKIDDVLSRRGSEISRQDLRKLFNYLMKNKRPPKLATKRKAVCYDLVQTTSNPPTFELLVKDKDAIHWSYERFLNNIIRKQFKLNDTGVKIKITEVFRKNVDK